MKKPTAFCKEEHTLFDIAEDRIELPVQCPWHVLVLRNAEMDL